MLSTFLITFALIGLVISSIYGLCFLPDRLINYEKFRKDYIINVFSFVFCFLVLFWGMIEWQIKDNLFAKQYKEKLISTVLMNKEINNKIIYYFNTTFDCNKDNLNQVDCAITIKKINKLLPDTSNQFSDNEKLQILLDNQKQVEINNGISLIESKN